MKKNIKIKKTNSILKEVAQIAIDYPDRIKIVDTAVDAKVQLRFFETLQKIDREEKVIDFEKLQQELYSEESSIQDKELALVYLSTIGDVKSYRLLEDYLKSVNKDLKNWAFIACQQSAMLLESSLLDEPKIFIASGLGGKNNCLRYSIVLTSDIDNLSESQLKTINGELDYFINKQGGVIETINYEAQYVMLLVLLPIQVNVSKFMSLIVAEINQYGNLLKSNILITNEKIINIDDIKDILEK